MAITASMVKELREMTGAGMMDCKKALNETDGDTSYNCGFKDALTGVRNYIRREIENL